MHYSGRATDKTIAYTSYSYSYPSPITTSETTSKSSSSSNPIIVGIGGFIVIFGVIFLEILLVVAIVSKISNGFKKLTKKRDEGSIFDQTTIRRYTIKDEEEEPTPILTPKPKPVSIFDPEPKPEPILAPKPVKKIAVTAPEEMVIPKYTATRKSTTAARKAAPTPKPKPKTTATKKTARPVRRTSRAVADSSIYEIINVKQRSRQWFDLREGKVTGTAAIHLKNHSVSYAASKSSYRSDYTNYAMERGRKLESIGISKFADEYGFDVETIGFVNSLVYEKAGFSPDGVILGDSGEIKTIVEHKAFNREHHLRCARKIDESVMYQIQFGMFVTGAKDAYLVLYNPDLFPYDKELIVKHIHRDGEIMSLFRSRYRNYKINGYAQ